MKKDLNIPIISLNFGTLLSSGGTENSSRVGGAVGKTVRLACKRFGVLIPSVVRTGGSDRFTAKCSATGMSVTGPRI